MTSAGMRVCARSAGWTRHRWTLKRLIILASFCRFYNLWFKCLILQSRGRASRARIGKSASRSPLVDPVCGVEVTNFTTAAIDKSGAMARERLPMGELCLMAVDLASAMAMMLDNQAAADIADAAVTRAHQFALVPHRKPGSQTCAATTHVVRSGPWLQAAAPCRKG
jgi:hypothetical protein